MASVDAAVSRAPAMIADDGGGGGGSSDVGCIRNIMLHTKHSKFFYVEICGLESSDDFG